MNNLINSSIKLSGRRSIAVNNLENESMETLMQSKKKEVLVIDEEDYKEKDEDVLEKKHTLNEEDLNIPISKERSTTEKFNNLDYGLIFSDRKVDNEDFLQSYLPKRRVTYDLPKKNKDEGL